MKDRVESFLVTCREILNLPFDYTSLKNQERYLSTIFFRSFSEELIGLPLSLKIVKMMADHEITRSNEKVADLSKNHFRLNFEIRT